MIVRTINRFIKLIRYARWHKMIRGSRRYKIIGNGVIQVDAADLLKSRKVQAILDKARMRK